MLLFGLTHTLATGHCECMVTDGVCVCVCMHNNNNNNNEIFEAAESLRPSIYTVVHTQIRGHEAAAPDLRRRGHNIMVYNPRRILLAIILLLLHCSYVFSLSLIYIYLCSNN